MLEYDNNNRIPDTKVRSFYLPVLSLDIIQLRDRERELLKDSFSSVNTAIDTIRQQCEEYVVSDIDLRDSLRNEGKNTIMELFQTYYNKFANKDFTKNREKYIRYEPRTLELIIESFFEHHF